MGRVVCELLSTQKVGSRPKLNSTDYYIKYHFVIVKSDITNGGRWPKNESRYSL